MGENKFSIKNQLLLVNTTATQQNAHATPATDCTSGVWRFALSSAPYAVASSRLSISPLVFHPIPYRGACSLIGAALDIYADVRG